MKWIDVKDRLPEGPDIIVAIMNGRCERGNDPIEDAYIVILRSEFAGDEWRTMDCTEPYYLDQKNGENYFHIIRYWISYKDFIFPKSMIIEDSSWWKECE